MKFFNSPSKPKQTKSSTETQMALNAYLVSAEALSRQGRMIDAELRLTEALALAQSRWGQHSEQAVLVLSIIAAFHRTSGNPIEAAAIEQKIQSWTPVSPAPVLEPEEEPQGGLRSQLLNKRDSGEFPKMPGPKQIPHNIRKACQILGLSAESDLTTTDVQRAWKKQLLEQQAHPDLGGNTDEAVLLNDAKAQLLEYLEFIKPRNRSTWKIAGQ